MYRERNLLFYEEALDTQLRERQRRAAGTVDGVSQDQFLVSSDEELTAYVEAHLHVEPVILHEDARSMRQEECQIDVSSDPRRVLLSGRGKPFLIPGTRVKIHIPFTGAAWLFRYRPSSYWTVFPHAEVNEERGARQSEIVITIEQPHDSDQGAFKRVFDKEIDLIRNYLGNVNAQVGHYNRELPGIIRQSVQHRRKRLERHQGLSALLDIPLQERPGAPSLQPVRVEIRPPPQLPVPPKTGLQPEPGIALETYEKILSVIRHEGRTFETTPGTYAKLDEEELRSVIVAHLNGQFQGEASGEVFRRSGKTDICIEEKNRAAFVGECKIWSGPAQVSSDLDQLLGYLTWRDSKAAFVVFNKKVREFSKILEGLPKAIAEHRCFIRSLECPHAGEWRVLMRSIEDEGRLVTVHVFAINIYTEAKKSSPKVRST